MHKIVIDSNEEIVGKVLEISYELGHNDIVLRIEDNETGKDISIPFDKIKRLEKI